MTCPDKIGESLSAVLGMMLSAGQILVEMQGNDIGVSRKPDGSQVSIADTKVNQYIVRKLEGLFPDDVLISEEGSADKFVEKDNYWWLVDPLDGTKAYVRGYLEYAVCVCLMKGSKPYYGFISWPAKNQVYFGGKGFGVFKTIQSQEKVISVVRERTKPGILASDSDDKSSILCLASKFNILGRELNTLPSAVKFIMLVEGEGSAYIRSLGSYEWDVAAGQALVEGSGGRVFSEQFTDLTYNKPNWLNGSFAAILD